VNLRKFEVLPMKNGSMFIYGGKSESKRSVKKIYNSYIYKQEMIAMKTKGKVKCKP
jgi:hypothetical protein